eukprot:m.325400 g.325400  ORF g.325400 m.325400 type:complete len:709 (+) comp20385_c0_seq1:72-2198(+)
MFSVARVCTTLLFVVLLLCQCIHPSDAAGCVPGENYPGGDLTPGPSDKTQSQCAADCNSTEACIRYVWHQPGKCSGHGEHCTLSNGCCYLKNECTTYAPNRCTCSELVRPCVPEKKCAPEQSIPKPPANAKNVLYLVVDDLRPELPPFGHAYVHAPNIENLARESTTFYRAYCQQAVCSPSRMSFLSGRRPDHTRTYNFINHFRQADCGFPLGGILWTQKTVLSNETVDLKTEGGAGQCCTDCTINPDCSAWAYRGDSNMCIQYAHGGGSGTAPNDAWISGASGKWTSTNWTAFPEHFRKSGYFTLQTGKIYHTEEGGTTPPWNGQGMPPNQDPPSWTPGCSMAHVNAVAPMLGCRTNDTPGCAVNATIDGEPLDGSGPLCDKTIGDDAVDKLKHASEVFNTTGRPFFLAVGFRKPHMSWRFPAPFLEFYNESAVNVAAHPTLDPSQPPIAMHYPCLQKSPYVAMPTDTARRNRMFYYAAVAWTDHQVGKVLTALEDHNLKHNTLVVFHSDHGWSLGEHGQWQKFTLWELGTRVPLIIRAPWVSGTQNVKSGELAELVDVYPTTCDLAGIAPPAGETLDGTSLGPLLRGEVAAGTVKPYALSQYPRCPTATNPADFWQSNWCEFVDRTQIRFMGYSIRTDAWRYTEWVKFNGSSLTPIWTEVVGKELYNHTLDNATDYDAFENVNEVGTQSTVAAQLSDLLHMAFKAE